jgi:hypothetical protein
VDRRLRRNVNADGNQSLVQMQTGGMWTEMQADIGRQIAVGPNGIAWAIGAPQ